MLGSSLVAGPPYVLDSWLEPNTPFSLLAWAGLEAELRLTFEAGYSKDPQKESELENHGRSLLVDLLGPACFSGQRVVGSECFAILVGGTAEEELPDVGGVRA